MKRISGTKRQFGSSETWFFLSGQFNNDDRNGGHTTVVQMLINCPKLLVVGVLNPNAGGVGTRYAARQRAGDRRKQQRCDDGSTATAAPAAIPQDVPNRSKNDAAAAAIVVRKGGRHPSAAPAAPALVVQAAGNRAGEGNNSTYEAASGLLDCSSADYHLLEDRFGFQDLHPNHAQVGFLFTFS